MVSALVLEVLDRLSSSTGVAVPAYLPSWLYFAVSILLCCVAYLGGCLCGLILGWAARSAVADPATTVAVRGASRLLGYRRVVHE
jgi:hypothetical protein